MRNTHSNNHSKYFYILGLLFMLNLCLLSNGHAGDATSFNPTAVAVKARNNGIPIGGVIPWPAGVVPEHYLECNGQSTAGYPELAAAIGGNVPDLRGEFVRGWDHGKGTDSGRSLMSSQNAAMQSHSHGVHIPVSVTVPVSLSVSTRVSMTVSTSGGGGGTLWVNDGSNNGGGHNGIRGLVEVHGRAHTPVSVGGGSSGGGSGTGTGYGSASGSGTGTAVVSGSTGTAGSGSETRPRNVSMMYIIRAE
ncbi:phage tail protein [Maridesulfovibrio sp.]|uniref:phage tail protein n=1 Tax=Maridesulfovibrio sp. TaxID=2795000 RepID=UPI003B00C71D